MPSVSMQTYFPSIMFDLMAFIQKFVSKMPSKCVNGVGLTIYISYY